MTCEACYCSRCHPIGAEHQCSACGQEIRWGTRAGQTGFLHRDDVDHAPIHGHRMTYAAVEEVRRQREEVVRERFIPTKDGFPLLFEIETYTTAQIEIEKDKDVNRRRRRLALLRGEDPDAPAAPPPPPEIARHDVIAEDFPPRSGIRQIINLVEKTDGWEVRRLTASRGPYMGADGSALSISDSVVLGARQVDGDRIAVATWRDGKFDTAYTGHLAYDTVQVTPVNATDLKAWIKEPPA